jgi:hypothetical protein
MKPVPHLPRNKILEEWDRPRTLPEWDRYYRREIPLRDRLAVFIDYLSYFAAADLCYLDHGLLEKPAPEVIFSIEYIAESLTDDSELMAALWIVRDETGERASRWQVQHRLLQLFGRIGTEAAHG